jgi:hypothetical protein
MATIAEFLFIRLFEAADFLALRLSGKMCCFLHFRQRRSEFGFTWHFVES